MPRRLDGRAFTFIETLLVVGLMAIIGLAVSRAIINGYAIWDRGRRLMVEEDAAIFYEKITRDLRNAMIFSTVPAEGGEDHLAFATMVRVPVDPKSGRGEGLTEQIGRVAYAFDAARGAIVRRRARYASAVEEDFDTERVLVRSVTRLRFRYYFMDDGEPDVRDTFEEGEMPWAVEVDVAYRQTRGDAREIRRLLPVPAAPR